MGWLRYLAFEPDDLAKLMTNSGNPEALDASIKALLKPGDDGSDRSYSHFTEKPAAYPLWPKE